MGTGLSLYPLIEGIQHAQVNINLVVSLLKPSQYFCCVILHNISIMLKSLECILSPKTNGKAAVDVCVLMLKKVFCISITLLHSSK